MDDFIFASIDLFHKIGKVDLLPVAFSDHKAVICSGSLRAITQIAPRWKFNSTLLRDTSFVAQMKIRLRQFININTGSVDDLRVIWDSIKGYIRSKVTLYSSTLRKVCSTWLDKLEAQFALFAKQLQ